jgi:VanZ family protein
VSNRSLFILAWIAVAIIAVLSVAPGELRPNTGAGKLLEHFGAYFITAALLSVHYPRYQLRICAFLIVYAAFFEVVQMWVPNRTGGLGDLLVSAIGAITGVGLMSLRRVFALLARR